MLGHAASRSIGTTAPLGDVEDWKQYISSMLTETERNLDKSCAAARSFTQLPPCKVPQVRKDKAGGSNVRSFDGTLAWDSPRSIGRSRSDTPSVDHKAEPSHSAPEASPLDALLRAARVDGSAESCLLVNQRLIDSLKCEFDLRGAFAQKHLEAVHEKLVHGLHMVEGKSFELAKQLEDAVTSALEGERAARRASEALLCRLDESVTSRGRVQHEVLLGIQETEVEHDSRLERLELEFQAFKLETQTRMVAEGKRFDELLEASGGPLPDESGSFYQRLNEVECALTMERDFRKQARANLPFLPVQLIMASQLSAPLYSHFRSFRPLSHLAARGRDCRNPR